MNMKPEFKIISDLIDKNSLVLDVGCGDGILMKFLKENKNIDTRGLEISKNKVQNCIGKGLAVFLFIVFDVITRRVVIVVTAPKTLLLAFHVSTVAILAIPSVTFKMS